MIKQSELIGYMFDGKADRLSEELSQWMQSSARFMEFVNEYRDKIRKKIRVASEQEGLLDVRAELDVARGVLSDKRLRVEYERGASAKRRIPDFTMTYRENLKFNIEVSRMQANSKPEERIVRILLEKLGQMQAGIPNLLVIYAQEQTARSIELESLMHQVKLRADKRDPTFYARTRYKGSGAFYKDFNRLNGILMWGTGGQLWANKQARPALERKVLRLISSLALATAANNLTNEQLFFIV